MHKPPHTSAPRSSAYLPRPARRAFTLTELLIVIGLITLIVTIAIPTFNAITGGRSIDAAENQLAALLGAARAEAIGLQEERGVFFYIDNGSGRVGAAMVRSVPQFSNLDLALDLAPAREHILLPVGVSLQTVINSASMAGGSRTSDGYLGQNTIPMPTLGGGAIAGATAGPTTVTPFGGVILFDGRGRLVSRQYALLAAAFDVTAGKPLYTAMGALLYNVDLSAPAAGSNSILVAPLGNQPTQVAFVMFDTEGFNARQYTRNDVVGSYPAAELNEEAWIEGDTKVITSGTMGNTAFYVINRYNGSLVRDTSLRK